jgi:hypothetical protein
MAKDGSCTTLHLVESRPIDETNMWAGEHTRQSFSEPQSYPMLLGDDITSELFSKVRHSCFSTWNVAR